MMRPHQGVRRGRYAAAATLPWLRLSNPSGLCFSFFPEGALQAITHGALMLNQGGGSPLEDGLSPIYLRIRTRGGWQAWPLVGPSANARLISQRDSLGWICEVGGLHVECILRMHETEAAWCWTLRVANPTRRAVACDALYAQDVGLASLGALRANEMFVSHYLDHHVLRDRACGPVICTRQNLPQDGRCPGLLQGCHPGAVGFATDGLQFFGLGVKAGEPPAAFQAGLPSRIVQGEMALPALQGCVQNIEPGGQALIHFWAALRPDVEPWRTSAARELDLVRPWVNALAGRAFPMLNGAQRATPRTVFSGPVLNGDPPTQKDLRAWFGASWRHEERCEKELLSFWHGSDRHVVLPTKELACERPHGHILRSDTELYPSGHALSATAFMAGLFLSYVTVGNLSFNRFLSIGRDPLHLRRAAGQRVFVRVDSTWRRLAMPSAFEISARQCRWFYKVGRRCLVLEARVTPGQSEVTLELRVKGQPLACLITHEVVAGQDVLGGAVPWRVDPAKGRFTFRPAPGELLAGKWPDSSFSLQVQERESVEAWGGDELLYDDGCPRGYPYAVIRTKPLRRVSLVLSGHLERSGKAASLVVRDETAWSTLAGGLALRRSGSVDVPRLDDMLKWHAESALTHLLSPHGLEQFTGAAWGVRDVCQGPVEFLLALRKDAAVRRILETVFSHQYQDTGWWPQWFMFDEYRAIQSRDSHGDVGIWPLKALCDYVETTSDFGILEAEIPFTRWPGAAFTAARASVVRHVDRLLDRIEREMIPGSALVRYGHGDWDDTLQPSRRDFAERQVSSWTVALLFQTLVRYAEVARRAGDRKRSSRAGVLAERMQADFHRWLMPDGVVAGFALFPSGGGEPEQILLHPSDRVTGIRYRLISMTRGILSGLFSAGEARRHIGLIERHLTFPDGVRLVDRPVAYHGGRMQFFQRAETSAYCGREVGLMYVHAHLRYLESLTRMGYAEQVWPGLLAVTPIQLLASVPHAEVRQSNAYFSSSDGAFSTRYDASRNFSDLRTGRIKVKGGWRIYSSGPGLYFGLTLNQVLGLRYRYGDWIVDPVLPTSLDGLTLDREIEGKPVRVRYGLKGPADASWHVVVNGRPMKTNPVRDNPYRAGGVAIPVEELRRELKERRNLIEITPHSPNRPFFSAPAAAGGGR